MKEFNKTSSKSDKIHHHDYGRFYPFFLNQFRDQNCEILEIGLDQKESVTLWKEFLPNAQIHGIDINKMDPEPGVNMYQVDQSNATQLSEFATGKTNIFSVILDDGSHVPSHQILTIEVLWPTLKPGGIYIIEDIETSWWGRSEIYGYGFNSQQTNLIEYFKDIPALINREFSLSQSSQDWMNEIDLISFGQNCIILQKCTNESLEKLNRRYRFTGKKDSNSLSRKLRKSTSNLIRRFRQKIGLL